MPSPDRTNDYLLEVEGLAKAFKGLQALQDYHLHLRPSEIVGIIGPNGAGKTTIFNVVTGFYPPSAGKVIFDGHDITYSPPDVVTRLGLVRTFQNVRLFGELTVLDNVKAAQQLHTPRSLTSTILSLPSFLQREKEVEERTLTLLETFGLAERRTTLARNLPYGDQRRLEIARALATGPKVLLLDEPAAGMNPHETDELHQLILYIREHFNLTIVLVEHDMRLVMNLCERIQVLNYGRIIAEGPPDEIRNDPQVVEAYLGHVNEGRAA
ncbi:MAG: ABC transporter ATP-binding protein [Chloroflexi bacterium]|nr:MAG: ABC transporter ATP-binding protein [Chloroflexota bacterium]